MKILFVYANGSKFLASNVDAESFEITTCKGGNKLVSYTTERVLNREKVEEALGLLCSAPKDPSIKHAALFDIYPYSVIESFTIDAKASQLDFLILREESCDDSVLFTGHDCIPHNRDGFTGSCIFIPVGKDIGIKEIADVLYYSF